jgi:hypothetical protein
MATLTASGYNGQVTIDGEFLVISRKGLGAKLYQGLKGDKRIPISSITSVQLREPKVTDGFIQFGMMGSIDSGGGVFAARNDENSVSFYKKDLSAFLAVRDYIENKIVERSKPQVITVQGAAPVAPPSKLDQLKQLGELRDAGVLTPEEFEAEKAKIMAS